MEGWNRGRERCWYIYTDGNQDVSEIDEGKDESEEERLRRIEKMVANELEHTMRRMFYDLDEIERDEEEKTQDSHPFESLDYTSSRSNTARKQRPSGLPHQDLSTGVSPVSPVRQTKDPIVRDALLGVALAEQERRRLERRSGQRLPSLQRCALFTAQGQIRGRMVRQIPGLSRRCCPTSRAGTSVLNDDALSTQRKSTI